MSDHLKSKEELTTKEELDEYMNNYDLYKREIYLYKNYEIDIHLLHEKNYYEGVITKPRGLNYTDEEFNKLVDVFPRPTTYDIDGTVGFDTGHEDQGDFLNDSFMSTYEEPDEDITFKTKLYLKRHLERAVDVLTQKE